MSFLDALVARRREIIGMLSSHFPSLLPLALVLAFFGRDALQFLRDPRQAPRQVLLRSTSELVVVVRFLFFRPF